MDKPFGNRPYDRQGQRFSKHGPVRPHGTDYNYEPPRRMLVAVKQGMVHPKPPTYRRMDMDSFLRKLPIEHSRSSTSRSAGISFSESEFTSVQRTMSRVSLAQSATKLPNVVHEQHALQSALKCFQLFDHAHLFLLAHQF